MPGKDSPPLTFQHPSQGLLSAPPTHTLFRAEHSSSWLDFAQLQHSRGAGTSMQQLPMGLVIKSWAEILGVKWMTAVPLTIRRSLSAKQQQGLCTEDWVALSMHSEGKHRAVACLSLLICQHTWLQERKNPPVWFTTLSKIFSWKTHTKALCSSHFSHWRPVLHWGLTWSSAHQRSSFKKKAELVSYK